MLYDYIRPRYQVSVYRTIGPLVLENVIMMDSLENVAACDLEVG